MPISGWFATADKALHYVMAENLEEFRKANQVIDEQAAWEGGQRGVLTARRARAEGFCKALAENPAEVAHIYQIGGQSSVEDPTLGQAIRPIWIKISGPLDSVKVGYLARRIDQARQEKVNLIFFQIDSPGGLDSAADSIADQIAVDHGHEDGGLHRRPGPRRRRPFCPWPAATSSSRKRPGWARSARSSWDATTGLQDLSDAQVQVLTKKAAFLAGKQGHPEAVARAMVDPATEVVEARDQQHRRRAAAAPRGGRCRPGTVPGHRGPQEVRDYSDPHRRRGRGLWTGAGRQRRGGAQRTVRAARQADPRRRTRPGSIRWSRS